MSENLNEPQSRTEEILQNALGEEYDVTPQSRVEKLLTQIFEGGGSGGGSSKLQYIELGQVGGSFTQISSTPAYSFWGGGNMSKTMGEMIGDKTVVGFYFTMLSDDGKHQYQSSNLGVTVRPNPQVTLDYDFIANQYSEEIRNSTNVTVSGLFSSAPTGGYGTLYAICI